METPEQERATQAFRLAELISERFENGYKFAPAAGVVAAFTRWLLTFKGNLGDIADRVETFKLDNPEKWLMTREWRSIGDTKADFDCMRKIAGEYTAMFARTG